VVNALSVAAALIALYAAPADDPPPNRTSAYFDLWFERCDPAALSRMTAPDVEVINGGAISFARADELKFYEARCKEPGFGTPSFRDRREEVTGTFRSTLIKDFGVLETGEQRFVRREPDGRDRELARTKFLSLWERTGDTFRLKRMYAYDVVTP
jgi:hypothetical protein